MPRARPRNTTESRLDGVAFGVTPWQSKNKRGADGGSTAATADSLISDDACDQLQAPAPAGPALCVEDALALLTDDNTGVGAGNTAAAVHIASPPASPPPAMPPTDSAAERELRRQASFDGLELPPIQPARRHLTHQPLLHPDAAPPNTAATTDATAHGGPTGNQGTQGIKGTCKLAVLPGRVAYSGHLVDDASRACIGIMGRRVRGMTACSAGCFEIRASNHLQPCLVLCMIPNH